MFYSAAGIGPVTIRHAVGFPFLFIEREILEHIDTRDNNAIAQRFIVYSYKTLGMKQIRLA